VKDVAAERAVLASFFAFGLDAFDDVSDLLCPSSFTDETGQVVYRCAEQHFRSGGKALDLPSLLSSASSLKLSDHLASDEQKRYVGAIARFPAKRENVRKLARKLRRLQMARELACGLREASLSLEACTGDEGVDRILALAEGPAADVISRMSESHSDVGLIGEGAEEYVDFLADNPRDMVGVSTGMPHYDLAIGGGLQENSLDVIAARAKIGKSQIVDNVAKHIAGKLGVHVLNIDTEMSKTQHWNRVLANMTGIPVNDIKTGRFAKNGDREKVKEAARRLKAMPYSYSCVIGLEFEEVLSKIRRWLRKAPRPAVVIFDYIKMMSADFVKGGLAEHQALGFIVSGLKNLMGTERAACLCFAQVNREGIDREDTDIIAGSDRILHYCTSLTLYKKKTAEERSEYPEDNRYTHKLVPLASREGEGLMDGDYINVLADYSLGRVTEGNTRSRTAAKKRVKGGKKAEAEAGMSF